ncbi:hypothetical protein EDC04DRAFT_1909091 [Pisolithus marmoratus]|nr:hypothetical protein EDC04DRAFT_1909091 [Pisolithus marmoratus]
MPIDHRYLVSTPIGTHSGRRDSLSATKAALPLRRQFAVILSLQVAEPLTYQLISPFAPQFIRDIGVTDGGEAKVGFHVGVMVSVPPISPFFIGAGYLIISIGSLSFSRAFLAYPFRCTALAYPRLFFVGLVLMSGIPSGSHPYLLKLLIVYNTSSYALNGALNGIGLFLHAHRLVGELYIRVRYQPIVFLTCLGTWNFERVPLLPCVCSTSDLHGNRLDSDVFVLERDSTKRRLSRQLIKSKCCRWSYSKKDFGSELPTETFITNENDENKPLPLRALLIPQELITTGIMLLC